jgi:hypothetical protein
MQYSITFFATPKSMVHIQNVDSENVKSQNVELQNVESQNADKKNHIFKVTHSTI